MTFADHSLQRRQRLSSYWTIEDIVYGAFGCAESNPDSHAVHGHFSQLGASYPDALPQAVKVLEQNRPNLYGRTYTDFEDLFTTVDSLIRGISGIGLLAVYDMAVRLGCSICPKIIPLRYVYTHGTGSIVDQSARTLLGSSAGSSIVNDKVDVDILRNLYPCLEHYSALEIEDILCVYNKYISSAQTFDPVWLRSFPATYAPSGSSSSGCDSASNSNKTPNILK
ncbi:hypothetical protein [Porphyromonas bennonis]|uniref:hypothetical protein n=1 Tax=Porphyromonas bennonis TaxID=501496 RepID=UPI000374F556|nr:hypothetical protein [Porphyromonas bennonis]